MVVLNYLLLSNHRQHVSSLKKKKERKSKLDQFSDSSGNSKRQWWGQKELKMLAKISGLFIES